MFKNIRLLLGSTVCLILIVQSFTYLFKSICWTYFLGWALLVRSKKRHGSFKRDFPDSSIAGKKPDFLGQDASTTSGSIRRELLSGIC